MTIFFHRECFVYPCKMLCSLSIVLLQFSEGPSARANSLRLFLIYSFSPSNLADTTTPQVWQAVQTHSPQLTLMLDIRESNDHLNTDSTNTFKNLIPGMPLVKLWFYFNLAVTSLSSTLELLRIVAELFSGSLETLWIQFAPGPRGRCWPVADHLIEFVNKCSKLTDIRCLRMILDNSSIELINNQCHLPKKQSKPLTIFVNKTKSDGNLKDLPDKRIRWHINKSIA